MAYLKKRVRKTKGAPYDNHGMTFRPEIMSEKPLSQRSDFTPEMIESALMKVDSDLRKAPKRPAQQPDAFWPLVFVWFTGALTGYGFALIHPDAFHAIWDKALELIKVIL